MLYWGYPLLNLVAYAVLLYPILPRSHQAEAQQSDRLHLTTRHKRIQNIMAGISVETQILLFTAYFLRYCFSLVPFFHADEGIEDLIIGLIIRITLIVCPIVALYLLYWNNAQWKSLTSPSTLPGPSQTLRQEFVTQETNTEYQNQSQSQQQQQKSAHKQNDQIIQQEPLQKQPPIGAESTNYKQKLKNFKLKFVRAARQVVRLCPVNLKILVTVAVLALYLPILNLITYNFKLSSIFYVYSHGITTFAVFPQLFKWYNYKTKPFLYNVPTNSYVGLVRSSAVYWKWVAWWLVLQVLGNWVYFMGLLGRYNSVSSFYVLIKVALESLLLIIGFCCCTEKRDNRGGQNQVETVYLASQ